MLVIGFSSSDCESFEADLDISPDDDSPQEIHDALSHEADGMQFDLVLVINKDELIAKYSAAEGDYTAENVEEEEDFDMDE